MVKSVLGKVVCPKPQDFGCPKGLMSPYMLFWVATRDETDERVTIEDRFKNFSEKKKLTKSFRKQVEIAKELGKQWTAMKPEEKEIYVKTSLKLRAEYYESLLAWRKSDNFKKYLLARRDFAIKRAAKTEKDCLRELGMPEKPTCGYLQFAAANRKAIEKKVWGADSESMKINPVEVSKHAASAWWALKPEERTMWVDRSVKAREAYNEALISFRGSEAFKNHVVRRQLERMKVLQPMKLDTRGKYRRKALSRLPRSLTRFEALVECDLGEVLLGKEGRLLQPMPIPRSNKTKKSSMKIIKVSSKKRQVPMKKRVIPRVETPATPSNKAPGRPAAHSKQTPQKSIKAAAKNTKKEPSEVSPRGRKKARRVGVTTTATASA